MRRPNELLRIQSAWLIFRIRTRFLREYLIAFLHRYTGQVRRMKRYLARYRRDNRETDAKKRSSSFSQKVTRGTRGVAPKNPINTKFSFAQRSDIVKIQIWQTFTRTVGVTHDWTPVDVKELFVFASDKRANVFGCM